MDIKNWFTSQGSYQEGLKLYAQLSTCNANVLRQLQVENKSNFLTLKYELKKAIEKGINPTIKVEAKQNFVVATKPVLQAKPVVDTKVIIDQSVTQQFKKETFADYPPELHPTYRERVNSFYLACELKFKLNALSDNQEDEALKIILQLDDLWTKIDRCWMILNHWKEIRE